MRRGKDMGAGGCVNRAVLVCSEREDNTEQEESEQTDVGLAVLVRVTANGPGKGGHVNYSLFKVVDIMRYIVKKGFK